MGSPSAPPASAGASEGRQIWLMSVQMCRCALCTFRYSVKRRMRPTKCSALRIFPGTTSFTTSSGSTGLAERKWSAATRLGSHLECIFATYIKNRCGILSACRKRLCVTARVTHLMPVCARPSTSLSYSALSRCWSDCFASLITCDSFSKFLDADSRMGRLRLTESASMHTLSVCACE